MSADEGLPTQSALAADCQERVLVVLAQHDHGPGEVGALAVDLVADVDAQVHPPDLALAEILARAPCSACRNRMPRPEARLWPHASPLRAVAAGTASPARMNCSAWSM